MNVPFCIGNKIDLIYPKVEQENRVRLFLSVVHSLYLGSFMSQWFVLLVRNNTTHYPMLLSNHSISPLHDFHLSGVSQSTDTLCTMDLLAGEKI